MRPDLPLTIGILGGGLQLPQWGEIWAKVEEKLGRSTQRTFSGHQLDDVKSVQHNGLAHNKGGPADINIAQITHLSNFSDIKLIYEHSKLEQIDIQLSYFSSIFKLETYMNDYFGGFVCPSPPPLPLPPKYIIMKLTNQLIVLNT